MGLDRLALLAFHRQNAAAVFDPGDGEAIWKHPPEINFPPCSRFLLGRPSIRLSDMTSLDFSLWCHFELSAMGRGPKVFHFLTPDGYTQRGPLRYNGILLMISMRKKTECTSTTAGLPTSRRNTNTTLKPSGAAKSGVASKSHVPAKGKKVPQPFFPNWRLFTFFPRKLAIMVSILPSRFAAKRRDCRIVVPQLRDSWTADGLVDRNRSGLL